MLSYLLDVHIPLAVVDALRRAVPGVAVEHASRWREGRLRTASDADLLTAAAEAGLVFVTFDVRTVGPLADDWIRAGRSLPGLVLIPGSSVHPTDVGGIAQGLARLTGEPDRLDPAYPVVYLQTPP